MLAIKCANSSVVHSICLTQRQQQPFTSTRRVRHYTAMSSGNAAMLDSSGGVGGVEWGIDVVSAVKLTYYVDAVSVHLFIRCTALRWLLCVEGT